MAREIAIDDQTVTGTTGNILAQRKENESLDNWYDRAFTLCRGHTIFWYDRSKPMDYDAICERNNVTQIYRRSFSNEFGSFHKVGVK